MAVRLPALLAALWWGSLGTIGFLAVPLLFVHLPTPAMAGAMAARLLLISRPKGDVTLYPWARAATFFIVAGLLLALLVQFGVAPRIVARQDLRLWHSVGTVMYALQWVCALVTLWHTLRSPTTPPAV